MSPEPHKTVDGRTHRHVAVSVSIAAHALMGLLAAYWSTTAVPVLPVPMIDGRWKSQVAPESLLEVDSSPQVVDRPDAVPEFSLPLDSAVSRGEWELTPIAPEAWSVPDTAVGKAPSRIRQQLRAARGPSLAGAGNGFGNGEGDQPGFFGLQPAPESRIVFVVDHSRSMNHPHDSPAKTRYGRVKMELVKCILEMHDRQSFFVVFFGNEMTSMPGNQLCPSIAGVRDPYLQWIARLPSGGQPTNPLPALDYGLRLRPDVLCFLTDGDFDPRIKRRLVALKQSTTAIHTFAFGEVDAEETLKTLASNNRGEYRFVP